MKRQNMEFAIVRGRVFGILTLAVAALSASTTLADTVVNGDFSTGDLSGWLASSDSGTIPQVPITPIVSVVGTGNGSAAELSTGDFDTGPFISTLEQTFTVSATQPVLGFDVSFSSVADSTGSGNGFFGDAFVAVIQAGVEFFDIALVDDTGVQVDPFGSAPGSVSVDSPQNASLSVRVLADLTPIAGQTVTLFFDIVSEDDGRRSTAVVDNVGFPGGNTVVSEPATLALILTGLCVGCVSRRRQTRSISKV